MSFAFKTNEELYASDYIERKKALNNYQYFQKRLDNPKNKIYQPKTISNYDGTAYFMMNDASYYLAYSRSYNHLLSITKGAYLFPISGIRSKADVSCILCPDTEHNQGGELYEGNYYSVSSDVTINSIKSSSLLLPIQPTPTPYSLEKINYPEISQNACDTNLYNAYIKSGNIKFNDVSYNKIRYSYSQFKFPSTLRQ